MPDSYSPSFSGIPPLASSYFGSVYFSAHVADCIVVVLMMTHAILGVGIMKQATQAKTHQKCKFVILINGSKENSDLIAYI